MPADRSEWPDRYLVGNGVWCSECHGSGQGRITDVMEHESGWESVFRERCRACQGRGRIPWGERRVYDTTTKHGAKAATVADAGRRSSPASRGRPA